ncbi:DUF6445 family protein [Pseudoxanthomonas sp. 10H]|uniref:DUF6445 family protein n=1 Tax=Pseudoxanthomonas sp. 10H TaxID=3242729 RepID=UPI00355928F3
MPTSLLIVDDFLGPRDALALRAAGLRLTYPDLQGAFPGRNSVERIEIDGLDEAISRLVGERLRPAPPPQSHAKFRITLEKDVGRSKVHIDKAHWSGLLYLSLPEDCRGGTEFYRHLPTNSDRAPMTDAELAAAGFESQEQMNREIVGRDTCDDSKWEMTMRVPMRFNRLVMFRPWLWHTAGESFGDSLQNGRLVYLLFFEVV